MLVDGLSGQATSTWGGAAELEALAAAVDGLSTPVDGEGLAELLALADRLQARIHAAGSGHAAVGRPSRSSR